MIRFTRARRPRFWRVHSKPCMAVFSAESLNDRTRYILLGLVSPLTFLGMTGIIEGLFCVTVMADGTNQFQIIPRRFKAINDGYGMIGMIGMERQSRKGVEESVVKVGGRSVVVFVVVKDVFACLRRLYNDSAIRADQDVMADVHYQAISRQQWPGSDGVRRYNWNF